MTNLIIALSSKENKLPQHQLRNPLMAAVEIALEGSVAQVEADMYAATETPYQVVAPCISVAHLGTSVMETLVSEGLMVKDSLCRNEDSVETNKICNNL